MSQFLCRPTSSRPGLRSLRRHGNCEAVQCAFVGRPSQGSMENRWKTGWKIRIWGAHGSSMSQTPHKEAESALLACQWKLLEPRHQDRLEGSLLAIHLLILFLSWTIYWSDWSELCFLPHNDLHWRIRMNESVVNTWLAASCYVNNFVGFRVWFAIDDSMFWKITYWSHGEDYVPTTQRLPLPLGSTTIASKEIAAASAAIWTLSCQHQRRSNGFYSCLADTWISFPRISNQKDFKPPACAISNVSSKKLA